MGKIREMWDGVKCYVGEVLEGASNYFRQEDDSYERVCRRRAKIGAAAGLAAVAAGCVAPLATPPDSVLLKEDSERPVAAASEYPTRPAEKGAAEVAEYPTRVGAEGPGLIVPDRSIVVPDRRILVPSTTSVPDLSGEPMGGHYPKGSLGFEIGGKVGDSVKNGLGIGVYANWRDITGTATSEDFLDIQTLFDWATFDRDGDRFERENALVFLEGMNLWDKIHFYFIHGSPAYSQNQFLGGGADNRYMTEETSRTDFGIASMDLFNWGSDPIWHIDLSFQIQSSETDGNMNSSTPFPMTVDTHAKDSTWEGGIHVGHEKDNVRQTGSFFFGDECRSETENAIISGNPEPEESTEGDHGILGGGYTREDTSDSSRKFFNIGAYFNLDEEDDYGWGGIRTLGAWENSDKSYAILARYDSDSENWAIKGLWVCGEASENGYSGLLRTAQMDLGSRPYFGRMPSLDPFMGDILRNGGRQAMPSTTTVRPWVHNLGVERRMAMNDEGAYEPEGNLVYGLRTGGKFTFGGNIAVPGDFFEGVGDAFWNLTHPGALNPRDVDLRVLSMWDLEFGWQANDNWLLSLNLGHDDSLENETGENVRYKIVLLGRW